MAGIPRITRAWRSVGGPLDQTEVGRLLHTRTIALPPMLSKMLDFIVEGVVNGNVSAKCFVNAIHVELKFWSMIFSIPVRLSHEQKGMNHLMEQRVVQIGSGPEFQQWFAQPNRTQTTLAFIVALSGTEGHAFGPAHFDTRQMAVEKLPVELHEQRTNVGIRVEHVQLHRIDSRCCVHVSVVMLDLVNINTCLRCRRVIALLQLQR